MLSNTIIKYSRGFIWYQMLRIGTALLVGGIGTLYWVYNHKFNISSESRLSTLLSLATADVLHAADNRKIQEFKSWPTLDIPTREHQLTRLKSNEVFDILVIGGGATGCGVALDAATRGLSTALVERYDFGSGTSSKSTKLIHGGVRYLQKAVMGLDYEQYRLVKEALQERGHLMKIAPHLTVSIPIMLPVYTLWQIPYFWLGMKCYDMLAGKQLLHKSYFVSKSKALLMFPMLNSKRLRGAIIYYDGQHNDARMNIALAMTAAQKGAAISNHVAVTSLINLKGDGLEDDRVVGACVRDQLTGNEWEVQAKVVINATGPFTDSIRQMSCPMAKKICQPSAGVHIVLPSYYSPQYTGLLDPNTSDGRVIFFLPWEGKTVAGTTDTEIELTDRPHPSESSIQFILNEIRNYLDPDLTVRRGDVLAAWSGIRPLVMDPNSKHTQSISRNHVIEVDPSGLVTIAGGKWTTYRSMAEQTVDKAIEVGGLSPLEPCQTLGMILNGGEKFHPLLFIRLIQDYGLDHQTASHLVHCYGDKAADVARLASITGKVYPIVGIRMAEDFSYIEAEVLYATREYARTIVDVIARRTSLAFLNVQAAEMVVPRIADMMSNQLGWNREQREEQIKEAYAFLQSMGLKARRDILNSSQPIAFSDKELKKLHAQFKEFDRDCDGAVSLQDLQKVLENIGEKVSENELKDMIAEVDKNKNQIIEFDEFLQVVFLLKTGLLTDSRFGTILKHQEDKHISVGRSGGGL